VRRGTPILHKRQITLGERLAGGVLRQEGNLVLRKKKSGVSLRVRGDEKGTNALYWTDEGNTLVGTKKTKPAKTLKKSKKKLLQERFQTYHAGERASRLGRTRLKIKNGRKVKIREK